MLRNLTFVWQFAYFSIRPKKVLIPRATFDQLSSQKQLLVVSWATFWEITGNFLENLEQLLENPNWGVKNYFFFSQPSKVASITEMIYFHIILHSAVHTYDFCIKQKRQGWFYSRKYIYIFFTNISEGTSFLLQGLTYSDGVKLRRYNLK